MYHLLSNVTSDFKYLSKTKIASIYTQDGKKVSSAENCHSRHLFLLSLWPVSK